MILPDCGLSHYVILGIVHYFTPSQASGPPVPFDSGGFRLRFDFMIHKLTVKEKTTPEGVKKSNSRFGYSPNKRFSLEELIEQWLAYKDKCDNDTKKVSCYDAKEGKYITNDVPSPTTYTITGFCCYIHMSRSSFNKVYANDPGDYGEVVKLMLQECQECTRARFEKNEIPSTLAKIWMHNFSEYKEGTDDTSGQVVIAPMYGVPAKENPPELPAGGED